MFKTLPEHVFWDIKRPLNKKDADLRANKYAPFRPQPFENLFDFYDYEEYLERKFKKENKRDGLSMYRRY